MVLSTEFQTIKPGPSPVHQSIGWSFAISTRLFSYIEYDESIQTNKPWAKGEGSSRGGREAGI